MQTVQWCLCFQCPHPWLLFLHHVTALCCCLFHPLTASRTLVHLSWRLVHKSSAHYAAVHWSSIRLDCCEVLVIESMSIQFRNPALSRRQLQESTGTAYQFLIVLVIWDACCCPEIGYLDWNFAHFPKSFTWDQHYIMRWRHASLKPVVLAVSCRSACRTRRIEKRATLCHRWDGPSAVPARVLYVE
jgi:hypothetical protein